MTPLLTPAHELVILAHNPTPNDPYTVGVPVLRLYTTEQEFPKALNAFGVVLQQHGTDTAMLVERLKVRIETLEKEIAQARRLRESLEVVDT